MDRGTDSAPRLEAPAHLSPEKQVIWFQGAIAGLEHSKVLDTWSDQRAKVNIAARCMELAKAGEIPALERKRAEEFFAKNPLANGRDGRN